MYKIRWKKGNATFESKRSFKTKAPASKHVRIMKQLDDDLPVSRRDKSLKTYRVVKVPNQKKIRK